MCAPEPVRLLLEGRVPGAHGPEPCRGDGDGRRDRLVLARRGRGFWHCGLPRRHRARRERRGRRARIARGLRQRGRLRGLDRGEVEVLLEPYDALQVLLARGVQHHEVPVDVVDPHVVVRLLDGFQLFEPLVHLADELGLLLGRPRKRVPARRQGLQLRNAGVEQVQGVDHLGPGCSFMGHSLVWHGLRLKISRVPRVFVLAAPDRPPEALVAHEAGHAEEGDDEPAPRHEPVVVPECGAGQGADAGGAALQGLGPLRAFGRGHAGLRAVGARRARGRLLARQPVEALRGQAVGEREGARGRLRVGGARGAGPLEPVRALVAVLALPGGRGCPDGRVETRPAGGAGRHRVARGVLPPRARGAGGAREPRRARGAPQAPQPGGVLARSAASALGLPVCPCVGAGQAGRARPAAARRARGAGNAGLPGDPRAVRARRAGRGLRERVRPRRAVRAGARPGQRVGPLRAARAVGPRPVGRRGEAGSAQGARRGAHEVLVGPSLARGAGGQPRGRGVGALQARHALGAEQVARHAALGAREARARPRRDLVRPRGAGHARAVAAAAAKPDVAPALRRAGLGPRVARARPAGLGPRLTGQRGVGSLRARGARVGPRDGLVGAGRARGAVASCAREPGVARHADAQLPPRARILRAGLARRAGRLLGREGRHGGEHDGRGARDAHGLGHPPEALPRKALRARLFGEDPAQVHRRRHRRCEDRVHLTRRAHLAQVRVADDVRVERAHEIYAREPAPPLERLR